MTAGAAGAGGGREWWGWVWLTGHFHVLDTWLSLRTCVLSCRDLNTAHPTGTSGCFNVTSQPLLSCYHLGGLTKALLGLGGGTSRARVPQAAGVRGQVRNQPGLGAQRTSGAGEPPGLLQRVPPLQCTPTWLSSLPLQNTGGPQPPARPPHSGTPAPAGHPFSPDAPLMWRPSRPKLLPPSTHVTPALGWPRCHPLRDPSS